MSPASWATAGNKPSLQCSMPKADPFSCCQHASVLLATAVPEYHLTPEEQQQADGVKSVAVAVRRNNLLATAFHPELTDDVRW